MKIRVWFLTAVITCSPTELMAFELQCKGKESYYSPSTFDRGDSPTRVDSVRLIRIDADKGILQSDTLLGKKAGVLETSESGYSAALTHGTKLFGRFVELELMEINRFTGEAFSLYQFSPDGYGTLYMAFIGMCQKAEQRF